jgi:hypothetical protein
VLNCLSAALDLSIPIHPCQAGLLHSNSSSREVIKF